MVKAEDVVAADGVLLSRAAAREVVAALDHLGRLAAPRGMQLSERLRTIRRELATSSTRGITHADASAKDNAAQLDSHWYSSVAVDTAAAARALGITPGGVAWLCRNGRLTAARSGGRWLIDTASLRSYQLEREER